MGSRACPLVIRAMRHDSCVACSSSVSDLQGYSQHPHTPQQRRIVRRPSPPPGEGVDRGESGSIPSVRIWLRGHAGSLAPRERVGVRGVPGGAYRYILHTVVTSLREVTGKREGRPFLYECGRAGTPAPSPHGREIRYEKNSTLRMWITVLGLVLQHHPHHIHHLSPETHERLRL